MAFPVSFHYESITSYYQLNKVTILYYLLNRLELIQLKTNPFCLDALLLYMVINLKTTNVKKQMVEEHRE